MNRREATVALIVHLAEFDARRLFAGLGYSSTFRYCMEALRLSEDATFNRIEAARLARRFPVVVDMLASGALSPTTARMLARHLTAENQETLLAAAAGRSKQEVERMRLDRTPRPDVTASVKRRPDPTLAHPAFAIPLPSPPDMSTEEGPPVGLLETEAAAPPLVRTPIEPAPVRPVRPLGAERWEFRFMAGTGMRDKLREAQDLLGHAVPSGDNRAGVRTRADGAPRRSPAYEAWRGEANALGPLERQGPAGLGCRS